MSEEGESEEGGILYDPIVYLLILVFFSMGMVYYVSQQQSGAAIWEDYYSKVIVKIINFADGGYFVCLDVHKATEIAKKNEVKSFSEIFKIDNLNNEVCVKLSQGRKTCYNYFNGVDVVNLDLQLGVNKNEKGEIANVLCFNVKEVRADAG